MLSFLGGVGLVIVYFLSYFEGDGADRSP